MNKNSTPFTEHLLGFLVLAALFITPLLVFPNRLFPFTTSKSFWFMGVAELVFFLWVYMAVRFAEYRLSKSQIITLLVPGALLLPLTISGIYAPNQNMAFWASFERGTGLIFLYHCFAFMLVVASLIRVQGKSFLQKIYTIIFASGIIVTLATFIGSHGTDPHSVVFNNITKGHLLGNSSYTGAYLVFVFFVGIILLQKAERVWKRLFVGAGLLAIAVSMIMMAARGATIGLVVGAGVAFLLWLAMHSKKPVRWTGRMLLIAAVAGVFVTGILFLQPTSKIHNAFVRAASDSRFIFWHAAEQGIAERPLFGWGPENYHVVFAKYFDPNIFDSTREAWADKPHNAVLEAFVSGGFVGGILYLLWVLSFFVLPVYLYRKKVFSKIEFVIFEGMFFAYFLQNLIVFDTVTSYMMLFALFGVLIGSIPVSLFPETEKQQTGIASNTVKIFTIMACAALFIPAWVYFVHLPAKKSAAIKRVYDSNALQKDFSVVIGISPMGNGRDVGYIANQLLGAYQRNIAVTKQDPKRVAQAHADIEKFLSEEVDQATMVAAADYRLWISAGKLVNFDMTIMNTFDETSLMRARTYLNRAITLSPTNPQGYWALGQTDAYAKRVDDARTNFIRARDLDMTILASHQYLIIFERVFGNKKTLGDAMAQLGKYFPEEKF